MKFTFAYTSFHFNFVGSYTSNTGIYQVIYAPISIKEPEGAFIQAISDLFTLY